MNSLSNSIARSRFNPAAPWLLLALIPWLINGCSLFQRTDDGLSEDDYYSSAQQALLRENYALAVTRLTAVEERYPFGRYAQQVQLELIYALHQQQKYTDSLLRADRFLRLHPQHQQADYAQYLMGLNYFYQYMNASRQPSERDQTEGLSAYSTLLKLVRYYPNSRYIADARQHLIALRNQMARHELQVAQFYLKRNLPVAAITRARLIIEQLPYTPAQADSLVLLVVAYRQLSLEDEAQAALQTLKLNYPDHSAFNRQGEFVSPYQQPDRLWLRIVSFGALG